MERSYIILLLVAHCTAAHRPAAAAAAAAAAGESGRNCPKFWVDGTFVGMGNTQHLSLENMQTNMKVGGLTSIIQVLKKGTGGDPPPP